MYYVVTIAILVTMALALIRAGRRARGRTSLADAFFPLPFDERAVFSSTGPEVELAAPGLLILAPLPGGFAEFKPSPACPLPL